MTIKTKIYFKDYRKLLFGLAYKKPLMKVIVGVDLLMIFWVGIYYLHLLAIPKPQIYQYITLVLITIVQPSVIYWTIKRNYNSSNHLREQLEIGLTEREINITGESFYTKILMNKVFKIDELRNWFLIYQNNLSAISIPKKDLDEADLAKLNTILENVSGTPVHLLKKSSKKK